MILEAADFLQLAEDDPARCIAEGTRLIESDPPPRESGVVRWAMGVAYRSTGEIDRSIESLEAACRDLARAGESTQVDEVRISLAASVAMSGRLGEAMESLESLIRSVEPAVRAHAQVQLAGLRALSGDFTGALELYDEAQPELVARNDKRWLALLHSTRGLVHTYRSAYADAESDLNRARQLFIDLNRDSSASEMLHNLGFLAVQRGDIAEGLKILWDADAEFRAAGLPVDAITANRAYAYMLAGLPTRAQELSETAAARLNSSGRELESADVLLQAARAALASGDVDAASKTAARAIEMTSTRDRPGWLAIGELLLEESALRAGSPGEAAKLEDLARRMRESSNLSGEAQALGFAAIAALDGGLLDDASRYIDDLDRLDETLIGLNSRVWLAFARARSHLAFGRPDSCLSVLEAAVDVVDEHRAVLGAEESHAGLSLLTDDLARLGMEAIGPDGEVVTWIERFRGSSLRILPVVANPDPEMAAAQARLRVASRQLEESRKSGEGMREAAQRVSDLERQVRDLALLRPGSGRLAKVADLATIREGLGTGQHMAYLFDVQDMTRCELIGEDRSRSFELADSQRVRSLTRQLLSLMRRQFTYPARSDPARLRSAIGELGTMMFADVEVGDLVVVPPADLLGLPWCAMAHAVDPGMRVVVAPSAAVWLRSAGTPVREGPVVAVAGPDLSYSDEEARRVAYVHGPDASAVDHERATLETVLDAIGGSSLLHAVAHGRLRDDNPMFSSLALADGDLNLYELERVAAPPGVVVLSACDSAHGHVVNGSEVFGLTTMFLSRGTRSIVSTVAPIPDSGDSIGAVTRLHEGLAEGKTASESIRDAIVASHAEPFDPINAFVAYGA